MHTFLLPPAAMAAATVLALCGSTATQAPRGLGSPLPLFKGNSMNQLDVENLATTHAGVSVPTLPGPLWHGSNIIVTASTAAGLHRMYEFDPAGNVVATYMQPAGVAGSSIGLRGLDPHPTSGMAWGMADDNVAYEFDPAAGLFTGSTVTLAGLPPVVTSRGLAIADVDIGGARPVFVSQDGNANIFFHDMSGTPLPPVLGVAPVQPDCHGIAWHPGRGTLWFHGRSGGRVGRTSVFTEWDPQTMQTTGQTFTGDPILGDGQDIIICPKPPPFPPQDFGILAMCDRPAGSGGDVLVAYDITFDFAAGCDDIGFGGEAYVGNGGFTVKLDNAQPTAVTALNFATARGPAGGLPLPFLSCNLQLDPISLVVGASMFTDGSGAAAPVLAIPNNPVLGGVSLTMQWFTVHLPLIDASDGGHIYIRP